jgi:dolichyl-phosphate-mannose--protein O-mannosyl transferase
MEKSIIGKIGLGSRFHVGWHCAAIFMAGWSLFLLGITHPDSLYWDEVNYIPAVRSLLKGVIENREHPPLAKELMSLGLIVFGDTPLGWRFMTSMFGALSLTGIYLWSLALFQAERPAILAVIFTAFNQMLYVESRTANIDIFMVTFMLGALTAFTASWRATTPEKRRMLIMLSGACFGLSAACKWIGVVPWMISIGIVVVVKQFQLWRVRFEDPHGLDWYSPSLWSGVRPVDWWIGLGVIPLALYYLAFLPTYGLISLPEFLEMHVNVFVAMSNSHQPPILLSHWTTWAFDLHPNYFTFTPWVTDAKGHTTASVVALLGNPLVIWLGLPAICLCVRDWIMRRRFDAMLISAFYLGLYLFWAVSPRAATMFTYYFPPAMVLGVALAYILTQTSLARQSMLANGMVIACALTFLMFLPLISAGVGITPWVYNHLMWFNDWRWPPPGY